MKDKQKEVPKQISDYMSAIGKKGGETNKKKGSEYFREISKKRWNDNRTRTQTKSKRLQKDS